MAVSARIVWSARLRGLCALIVFCVLALRASLELNRHILWAVLARHRRSARRCWAAECSCRYGARMLAAVSRVLELTVVYRLPAHPVLLDRTRPLLIVSNHQTTLDGLVLMNLLHDIGRGNVRWIAKRSLGWAPVTGRFLKESGCPLIERKGLPKELEAIGVGARQAAADRATMFIFPEGHRFRKAVAKSGLTHVLPPKKRGFLILRQELAHYPILSLTINWDRVTGGKTWLESGAVVGKRALVHGEIIENLPFEQSEEWLLNEWRRKDLWLSET